MSEEDDRRALGRAIRAARVRNGLTQAHLAEEAGLPFPTLVRMESGRSPIGLQDLQDLAAALATTGPALLRAAGIVSDSFLR